MIEIIRHVRKLVEPFIVFVFAILSSSNIPWVNFVGSEKVDQNSEFETRRGEKPKTARESRQ
jgi:hypothetical protein